MPVQAGLLWILLLVLAPFLITAHKSSYAYGINHRIKCLRNGQFLVNSEDTCSYFQCDHNSSGYGGKWVAKLRNCPPGTATNLYKFDPYAPCGMRNDECKIKPREKVVRYTDDRSAPYNPAYHDHRNIPKQVKSLYRVVETTSPRKHDNRNIPHKHDHRNIPKQVKSLYKVVEVPKKHNHDPPKPVKPLYKTTPAVKKHQAPEHHNTEHSSYNSKHTGSRSHYHKHPQLNHHYNSHHYGRTPPVRHNHPKSHNNVHKYESPKLKKSLYKKPQVHDHPTHKNLDHKPDPEPRQATITPETPIETNKFPEHASFSALHGRVELAAPYHRTLKEPIPYKNLADAFSDDSKDNNKMVKHSYSEHKSYSMEHTPDGMKYEVLSYKSPSSGQKKGEMKMLKFSTDENGDVSQKSFNSNAIRRHSKRSKPRYPADEGNTPRYEYPRPRAGKLTKKRSNDVVWPIPVDLNNATNDLYKSLRLL